MPPSGQHPRSLSRSPAPPPSGAVRVALPPAAARPPGHRHGHAHAAPRLDAEIPEVPPSLPPSLPPRPGFPRGPAGGTHRRAAHPAAGNFSCRAAAGGGSEPLRRWKWAGEEIRGGGASRSPPRRPFFGPGRGEVGGGRGLRCAHQLCGAGGPGLGGAPGGTGGGGRGSSGSAVGFAPCLGWERGPPFAGALSFAEVPLSNGV